MSTPPIIDGTAVEEDVVPATEAPDVTPDEPSPEVGTELVLATGGGELFHTEDPAEILEKAADVASRLKAIITSQNLTQRFGAKEHVLVEGWTTLGTLVNVKTVPVGNAEPLPWPPMQLVEGLDDGAVNLIRELLREKAMGYRFGFKAEYAVMKDGVKIGGAEAICTRHEDNWRIKRGNVVDDYALKSMAQTRAMGKALRHPLSFIVSLAGYAATPAEEMPATMAAPEPVELPAWARNSDEAQIKQLRGALAFMLKDEPFGPRVLAILQKLEKDMTVNGQVPWIAFRAVAHVAAAQKQLMQEGAPQNLPGHADASTVNDAPPPAAPAQGQMPTTTLPAGSVPMPNMDGMDAAHQVRVMRAAGCVCPSPLQGEDPNEPDAIAAWCPLADHGVPF